MSELMAMPTGFRFEPTDEELISSYLLRRVMGLPLSWNGILERDLYGENTAPWDVFKDIDEFPFYWHVKKDDDKTKGTKKIIYVFTKLVKVGPNSKRIARKAGCGTWDGQTGPRKIKSSLNGEIIGSARMLTYQHANRLAGSGPGSGFSSGSDTDSFVHWIMHEYSLDGIFLDHEFNKEDLVLCKITKCSRENVGGRHVRRNLSDKRLADGVEECEWENAWDQKKIKSSCNSLDEIDELLAGLESIKDWNIDALFRGLEEQPLAEDCGG